MEQAGEIPWWPERLPGWSSRNCGVFDTANGFQSVWHLGDAAEDSIKDATINRYHGISPDTARPSIFDGIIGICRQFDSSGKFITMPGTAGSKLDFPQNGKYSVSVWVTADKFSEVPQTLVSKGKYQYFLWLNSSSWQFTQYQDDIGWDLSAQSANIKDWVLLTGVREGPFQHLYVNGEPVDTVMKRSLNEPRSTTSDFIIGRAHDADYSCSFSGAIDEVRVHSTALSSDWIKLCYMNQRIDDRFIIFK